MRREPATFYNYAPEDLEAALHFLAAQAHRFPFATLVGKRFPLAEANRAFAYAGAQRPPPAAFLAGMAKLTPAQSCPVT